MKNNSNIQIYIVLGAIVVISILGFYLTNFIQTKGICSIAYIDKHTTSIKKLVEYHFFYRGKRYFGSTISNLELPYKKDHRYYVQFTPSIISMSQLTEIEVPDSIKEAPYNGWTQIPK